MSRESFDGAIGRLDRALSELLVLAEEDLDEADRQTLKHHADDLVGVGKKVHELLRAVEPGGDAETATARVLAFLRSAPTDAFGADEVASSCGVSVAVIRSMLRRLKAQGSVERTKRGLYQARTEG